MLDRVFAAVPDKVGQYDQVRVSWTACQYRNFVPITAETLRSAFMIDKFHVSAADFTLNCQFSIENRQFSGAILRYLCIFNRKLRKKSVIFM